MAMRCLLVDDNARFLEAAKATLERGGASVVALAGSSTDALVFARELRPDVALLDIDLDGENGFEVAERLHGIVPHLIMISTHDPEDFEELISESPVRGFLPKSRLSAEAVGALVGADG
ncbi:response regulator transcription factor [Streptomyces sp. TRM66268-LWL]|uniref:Response regulator transcription factor n=1 Tax=Streptomyces polyasparticus TaxID=2767826 RepID=A0ABR7S940_9ACTN|nr:response regulator transcription factor [Streptomyces polyasparticus]MBC9711990.1 response regulator transcription factor [Streptomyces polyasparticus]